MLSYDWDNATMVRWRTRVVAFGGSRAMRRAESWLGGSVKQQDVGARMLLYFMGGGGSRDVLC